MDCHGPAWGLGLAIVWNAPICADIAIGVICFLDSLLLCAAIPHRAHFHSTSVALAVFKQSGSAPSLAVHTPEVLRDPFDGLLSWYRELT